MTQLSDRARVQALLDEGRITTAEADILFAALGEDESDNTDTASTGEADDPEGAHRTETRVTPEQTRDEARARAHEAAEQARAKARAARESAQNSPATVPDRNVETVSPSQERLQAPQIIGASPQAQTPEAPRLPQPPTPPTAPPQTEDSIHTYPAGQKWARISGFCGDLDVRSDPTITEPSINGSASSEWDGSAFVIRTPPKDKEGGRGWLQRLHRAAGDLKVRLPEGMGLDLAIAAGDGSVRGVREVRGHFTGGDFDLRDAATIDLTVTAGDISIGLRPTTGQQRLRATSGDLDLTLLGGSSVKVSGRATCGDLDLPKGFNREGGVATQRFSGTVGAGDADLELRLTAGDVNVRLERE